jgi:hypothetical protein
MDNKTEDKEAKSIQLVGTIVGLQRLEGGAVKVDLLLLPHSYPPRLKDEKDEDYRSRIGPVLGSINQYNAIIQSGLRFDDILLVQEVLQ